MPRLWACETSRSSSPSNRVALLADGDLSELSGSFRDPACATLRVACPSLHSRPTAWGSTAREAPRTRRRSARRRRVRTSHPQKTAREPALRRRSARQPSARPVSPRRHEKAQAPFSPPAAASRCALCLSSSPLACLATLARAPLYPPFSCPLPMSGLESGHSPPAPPRRRRRHSSSSSNSSGTGHRGAGGCSSNSNRRRYL